MTSRTKDKQVKIYDLECLVNFFSYAAINRDNDDTVVYYLSPVDPQWRDQLLSLYDELENRVSGLIGYNNLAYDYPLLHHLLANKASYLTMGDPVDVVDSLYAKSQDIIGSEYSNIDERQVRIPQMDLYRMWHYDNKKVGLKALQISLQYENVQDMPFNHYDHIDSQKDIDSIIAYNINDIVSTKKFYGKSLEKIDLRKKLMSRYQIPCINWSDSKIGEELILKLYCEHTGKNPFQVKKMRTYRKTLHFNQCIPGYIRYGSKQFNTMLNYLQGIRVDKLKGSFEYSVIYKGFKYDLGTGGIHGSIRPGVYEAEGDWIIKDSDVASLYPFLAIKNHIYPAHLGPEFIVVYEEGIVNERIKAKRLKDMVTSDGLKLSANATYGKSNSEFSFLYDPLYTLRTTLAGQLSLCMLAEQLTDNIPELIVIQINTDGITTKFKKQYDELYNQICTEWETTTKLSLEHVYYSKMVIRDVNNYIAEYTDGKLKHKGAFEIDKVVGNEPAYYKDNSFRIIPYALSKYFIQGIPVEQTIADHGNIYDFCGRYKASHGWGSQVHYIQNSKHQVEDIQRTSRYYISNKGVKYFKVHQDGRRQEIEVGHYVTIFNRYVHKKIMDYDINYQYYIAECYKIINAIENKQMELF